MSMYHDDIIDIEKELEEAIAADEDVIKFTDTGPSHITLTAGDDGGDIFFCSNGKKVSLTGLIEFAYALGYDRLVEGEEIKEVKCDYERARSVLGK